ncbi:hypothetical protein Ga0074115_1512 [endosymbiont of Ridgeia piscesae]|uniref:Uncharacterized protein n=1 Tax=endosymbiont of Ridgeia piscesae TaxID=54398 RepID=A0A0T5Z0W7_9GAMM|nr:hypothetical protein Ga0074115_1512 [endosymbiont of Ridgeia piscesae]
MVRPSGWWMQQVISLPREAVIRVNSHLPILTFLQIQMWFLLKHKAVNTRMKPQVKWYRLRAQG